jgi:hypothetical protein
MSKGFINKICIYCNHTGSTRSGDHVFPRKIFLEKRRDKLPKVPCCKICNNNKSALEVYLLAVLPFGAKHFDAHENLTTQVPQRLQKNIKLYNCLATSMRKKYFQNDSGILESTMAIKFNINYLFDFFNYVTKALVYYHFGLRISTTHHIQSLNHNTHFDKFFDGSAQNIVKNDLGNGTIHYEGIQANGNDFLTLWRYRIYGGLQFQDQLSGDIVSYTCRNQVQKNIDLYRLFGI